MSPIPMCPEPAKAAIVYEQHGRRRLPYCQRHGEMFVENHMRKYKVPYNIEILETPEPCTAYHDPWNIPAMNNGNR